MLAGFGEVSGGDASYSLASWIHLNICMLFYNPNQRMAACTAPSDLKNFTNKTSSSGFSDMFQRSYLQ